jgi:hypothetical protein
MRRRAAIPTGWSKSTRNVVGDMPRLATAGLSLADLIRGGWLFDLAIVLLVLAATGAVIGGFCYLAGVEAGRVTEDASLSRIRRSGLVRTQAAARLTRPLFSLSVVAGLLGLVILLLVALTR